MAAQEQIPPDLDGPTESDTIDKQFFKLVPVGNSGWALYYAALMAKNLELADKSEVTSQKVLELVERIKPLLQANNALKQQIQTNMADPDKLTNALEDPFIYKSQKGRTRFTSVDDYIAKLSVLQAPGDFNKGPEAYPDIKVIASLLPNILEMDIVLFKPAEDNKYVVSKVFKKDADSRGTINLLCVNRENVDVLREKSDAEVAKSTEGRSITEILRGKKMKFNEAFAKAKQGLKAAARSVGKKLKRMGGLERGVISIAGIEIVNTTDVPTGDVEFIGNYYMGDEGMSPEELNLAAKPAKEIFNRIFAGKTYSDSNRLLPPCVEAERQILLEALKIRVGLLLDETKNQAIGQGITAEVAAKADALSRLQLLVGQLEQDIKNGKCKDYDKEGSPEELIKVKTEMDNNARLWLRKILFSALQVYSPVPGYEHLNKDAKDTITQLSKNPFTEDELSEYLKVWREQQEYSGEGIPEILGRILDQLDIQPGLLDVMLTDELKTLFNQLISWVIEDYAVGYSDNPDKVQEFRDYSDGLKTSTLNIKQRIVELIRWIVKKNIESWKELTIARKEIEGLKDVIEKQIAEIADMDAKINALQEMASSLLQQKQTLLEEIRGLKDNFDRERAEVLKGNETITNLNSEIARINTLNRSTLDNKASLEQQLAASKLKEAELQKVVSEKEKVAAAALEAQNTATATIQAASDKRAGEAQRISSSEAEVASLKGLLAAAEAKTASAQRLAQQSVKQSVTAVVPTSTPIAPAAPPAAPAAPIDRSKPAKVYDAIAQVQKSLGVDSTKAAALAKAARAPAPAAGGGELPMQEGGSLEYDLENCLRREEELKRQLEDAVRRYNELKSQNDDFRSYLKLSEDDLLKMRSMTTEHHNKRLEAEGKYDKLENELEYVKEQAETKNEIQAQTIVELTGDVDGLKAQLERKDALDKIDDDKKEAQIKDLTDNLGKAAQRAAAAENDAALKQARIDELNAIAVKVAKISEEQIKEKMDKLASLTAEIEELKKVQVEQKSTTTNKDFYINLRNYATRLLDNGNAGDPNGIAKGTPAFMELYRKTHILAANPSNDALLCYLNIFAEAILKQIFSKDDAGNRGKIDAILEKCIEQAIGDSRKDKITKVLKVLAVIVNNYVGGTPLEDQATYTVIYNESSKAPLAGVPSITPDKQKIFFTNATPPMLSSSPSDLPYNVVFVMMLLSIKKYIDEYRKQNRFTDANCDKLSKPPVDAKPFSLPPVITP